MSDRIQKLADQLVSYSMAVTPGDNVLIEVTGLHASPMAQALQRAVIVAGGNPFIEIRDERVHKIWLKIATEEQFSAQGKMELTRMKKMQCWVGVRATQNQLDLSDVPQEQMKMYTKYIMKQVHLKQRVNHTRWVVIRWPSPTFAYTAGLPTDVFEKFFFDACLANYPKMAKAMEPLVKLMERTDRVFIKGPGTHLAFSIKGIPVIPCAGKRNVPDGEAFTAPVRDSIEGTISYNTPSVYQGTKFEGIQFTFHQGRITEAHCNGGEEQVKKLNAILDSDEGARYVGEFAIGVNPFVTRPMLDTLFDEKIAGSFHLTPGNDYEEAPNGNRSQIHWDLVLIQTPEWGGGEICFDGKLIRKDGMFLPKNLQALNPTA